MQLKITISLVFTVLITYCHAQSGELATFTINDTKIVVNSNGALFWDGQDGQFISPFEEGESENSTMRTAGLWMIGTDPGGNLKGGIQLYNEGDKADFQAGTVDPQTMQPTGGLTGVYTVTSADIEAHLVDFNDNGIIDNPNPNVFGWPARGNVFFPDYHDGEILPNLSQGLASFWDNDTNGAYDPTAGDFPVISVRGCNDSPTYADEMAWFVYNDVLDHTESMTASLGMEIQVMVYGFECEELPFKNTIFTQHKMINRGVEDISDLSVGIFADFEIGNGNDDFIGTNTAQQLFFGYNGDDNDEGGYGTNAPAMAIDIMSGPINEYGDEALLTYAIPFTENVFTNPTQFQNLLTGFNADGSAGPAGGFAFIGNPNDLTETSEMSAGNTPGERKMVASFAPFLLQPGAINEIVMAHTAYQGEETTVAENIDLMYEKSVQLQSLFNNCFDVSTIEDICPPQTVPVSEVTATHLKIYPNPATHLLIIESEQPLSRINLISMDGRIMASEKTGNVTQNYSLDLSNFSAGVYFVEGQMTDGQEVIREKLVIVR